MRLYVQSTQNIYKLPNKWDVMLCSPCESGRRVACRVYAKLYAVTCRTNAVLIIFMQGTKRKQFSSLYFFSLSL
jgi:hypothetical protein